MVSVKIIKKSKDINNCLAIITSAQVDIVYLHDEMDQ